jgi:hypothetical protein
MKKRRRPEVDGAVSAPGTGTIAVAINQCNRRKKLGQVLENAS